MGRYVARSLRQLRGLHEDENPHHLTRGDLVVADNAARYGNDVGTRPGTVALGAAEDYANQLGGSKPIQGAYEWRSDFDANRKLVVVAEQGGTSEMVWSDDGTVYPLPGTPPTITAGQDNRWTFADHLNELYAAGGAATDDFWHLDPSTTTNNPTRILLPVSAGSTPRPQYVYSWRNYLLVNGLRGGTVADNNPTVSRFCTFASDPTVAANWPVGNTIGFSATRKGIDAYGTNYATGFSSYRDNEGDFLLILGNKNITAAVLDPANDFQVTDAIATGCVGQRAFVSLGLDSGDAVYMSERGVHSLRQSQQHGVKEDRFLSWKIRSTFATLNKNRFKHVVSAFDHINGRVVFAVSTGSNSAHDLLLVLDLDEQSQLNSETALWYKWQISGGMKINEMFFARDGTSNNDWHLYFFSTDGRVGRFSSDVFSDIDGAGSAYPYRFAIQTNHEAEGDILHRKGLGDVMITLQPGGDYMPAYRTIFDYGARSSGVQNLDMASAASAKWGVGPPATVWGGFEWGSAKAVHDEKVYGTGSGRTISHEISHAGENQPVRISRIDQNIRLSGEDAGDTN